MNIETISLEDLKEDPNNARRHPEKNIEAIISSLQNFGQVEALVVRKDTNTVIGGNGRLLAMRRMGWTQAEIIRLDITGDRAAALGVALNRTSDLAEWDAGQLIHTLEDFDLDMIGDLAFTETDVRDLEKIFQMETDANKQVEEDEVPEHSGNIVAKVGDVWTLGNHTVVCADCTEVQYPKNYDLLVTDPPYGVSYADKNEFLNAVDKGNRNQTEIQNDHMSVEDMGKFWLKTFTSLCKFAKPGACYYMTGPQGGDLSMMMLMMMQEAGWLLKHTLIWVKNNHVLGRCDYNYKHEPILYGWKPGSGHYYAGGSDTSIWQIDRPHRSKEHPTMKPVELFSKCVINGSKKSEIVVDPFLGSGTTLIAAEQLDRRCYGVEIEPKYVDVIVERWENLTGDKATHTRGSV